MSLFFFFNDTATTEIYTLSLHDALPIFTYAPPRAHSAASPSASSRAQLTGRSGGAASATSRADGSAPMAAQSARQIGKSTRLNSSHGYISYAVFCLEKTKETSRRSICAA